MTLEQYADLVSFAPYHKAGKLSSAFVAAHLGLTVQHTRRILTELSPPKQRPAWNRLSEEMRQFVIAEKEANPHRNCQWISELTSDRFETGISQSSVYRLLKLEGLLSNKPVNRKPRSRFEAAATGDLVQMDTCWGYWLEGKKICLILLLDDYSRYILHGYFFYCDSAYNNMQMIRTTVADYGIFRLLYTDNASFFKAIRHGKSMYQTHRQEEYEGEITKSCREIGITHITHKPYEPQGKGKIERLFRFIQERFISELQPGMTIKDVNTKFMKWRDWYNHKHVNRTTGVVPKERFNPEGFTPLSGDRNLEDIFCHKDTRKIDKCNCFSYQGVSYQIPSQMCMVANVVTLHVHPGRYIRVWHDNQLICQLHWQHKN